MRTTYGWGLGVALSLVVACVACPAPAVAAASVVLTTLHTFSPGLLGDGPHFPVDGVIQASDSNLYGLTFGGGANDAGAIYKLTTSGTFSTFYSFGSSGTDGRSPKGTLVQATDGNLYGVTLEGGANGLGTVFRISLAGVYTVLRSFSSSAMDVASPGWGLTQGGDGFLYGVSATGGQAGGGGVFKIAMNGSGFALIHSFGTTAYDAQGAEPTGPLFSGSDGRLFGLSGRGGASGFGTLYRLQTDGHFAIVYEFNQCFADGIYPLGRPVEGPDGTFYATAGGGGSASQWNGTLLAVEPSGPDSVLHRYPWAIPSMAAEHGLLAASDGNFYGVTRRDEADPGNEEGTLFVITPDGEYTRLYSFATSGTDGAGPFGELVQGVDGRLYGVNADVVYAATVSGVSPASYPARRSRTCSSADDYTWLGAIPGPSLLTLALLAFLRQRRPPAAQA